jgi:hypothetical protein
MGVEVKLPTIDDPLEAWCSFCAGRTFSPDRAYCSECRLAYRRFGEVLKRPRGEQIARALLGDVSDGFVAVSPRARGAHLK